MACSCFVPSERDPKPSDVLDVDRIMQEHVWQDFLTTLNWLQRWWVKRQRSKYSVEVPTHYFRLEEFKKAEVTPRLLSRDQTDGALENHVTNDVVTGSRGKDVTRPKGADSKKSCLVTTYVNDTDEMQQYKFRMEKTRKSTLGVTIQKGFTIGGKTSFGLGLPALPGSKVTGGFDMRFNVSKTGTDTIEETDTLETTSDIHVPKNSKVTAKVTMLESEVAYNFQIWTKLSLPTGAVPTFVRLKRDGHLCRELVLHDVGKFFPGERFPDVKVHQETVPVTGPDGKQRPFNRPYVVIKSSGIVEGVKLSDREIGLKAYPLGEQGEKEIQEVTSAGD